MGQDRSHFVNHHGSGHEESLRPVHEVMNEFPNGAIRGLLFEPVIDTKKQDDIVAKQVILTECRFQGCRSGRKIDDLEFRSSPDFGKDLSRGIHARPMNIATVYDGGAVACELKCDEPMIGCDVQHACALSATEQVVQSGQSILIHADHACAAPVCGAASACIRVAFIWF